MASSGKANALQQTAETLRKEMDANYIGAILTTIALIPLLQLSPKKAPAKIMIMSSMLGSAGLLAELGSWKAASSGYSASKAAISMWARKLAYDLASDESIGFPREGGWAVGLVGSDATRHPIPRTLTTLTASLLACRSTQVRPSPP